MLGKAVLALALASVPSVVVPQQPYLNRALVAAATPTEEQPEMMFMNYPLISRVDCAEGRGSAFRVGENHWDSAAHVTALHNCTIEGQPIAVTEQNGELDFSRLDTPLGKLNGFEIDCDGFKPGKWYWAAGFARGADFQTAVAIYATIYKHENGMRAFGMGRYTVIPGMSGGAVMDPDTGKVVGIVNAYNPLFRVSFSRELKDTSACQNSASVAP